jgi:hypothetical protein
MNIYLNIFLFLRIYLFIFQCHGNKMKKHSHIDHQSKYYFLNQYRNAYSPTTFHLCGQGSRFCLLLPWLDEHYNKWGIAIYVIDLGCLASRRPILRCLLEHFSLDLRLGFASIMYFDPTNLTNYWPPQYDKWGVSRWHIRLKIIIILWKHFV